MYEYILRALNCQIRISAALMLLFFTLFLEHPKYSLYRFLGPSCHLRSPRLTAMHHGVTFSKEELIPWWYGLSVLRFLNHCKARFQPFLFLLGRKIRKLLENTFCIPRWLLPCSWRPTACSCAANSLRCDFEQVYLLR